ncbi:MAG: hypothetical protein M1814_002231 [Vezdaea aestivalis]|nr:MAG: hypothetical protein M1814_002231 [Vezdaea aestivalis]
MSEAASSRPDPHNRSPSPGTRSPNKKRSKRKQGVQFSHDTAVGSSRTVAPTRTTTDTESSADETTALSSKGAVRRATYGTGASVGTNDADGNPEGSDSRTPNSTATRPPPNTKNTQPGWWERTKEAYQSIELENKGSVARDHLALERTYLAWLRTSLAFASIGIAITQLFRLNSTIAGAQPDEPARGYLHLRQVGKPLGATFLAISIVVLFVGFHRYFEAQHWIIRGKFPASRGSIALIAAISAGLIVTSLVVVLIINPRSFERK